MTGIVRKLEQAARAARQDSEFAAAVRELPCAILLQVLGLERSDTIVLWGEVRAAGPQDVCLQASPDIWERLAERVPAPGYHSFTAARRHAQGVRVLGADLRVAQALHALERYFELRGQVEPRRRTWIAAPFQVAMPMCASAGRLPACISNRAAGTTDPCCCCCIPQARIRASTTR